MKRVEKWVLRTGALIGAVIAIVTLPSAVHGVWKGWREMADRLGPVDIEATSPNFSIRCIALLGPEDRALDLFRDCLPKPLGASALVTFTNRDFVPRSIVGLTGRLVLSDVEGQEVSFSLDRARLVRHEIRNGRTEVVIANWASIDLAPQASVTHEVLLSDRRADFPVYGDVFAAPMFEADKAAFTRARLTIDALFENGERAEIYACENVFSDKAIESRRVTPGRRNQVPVVC